MDGGMDDILIGEWMDRWMDEWVGRGWKCKRKVE
jgi:hypothetical protein